MRQDRIARCIVLWVSDARFGPGTFGLRWDWGEDDEDDEDEDSC